MRSRRIVDSRQRKQPSPGIASSAGLLDAGPMISPFTPTSVGVWVAPTNTAHQVRIAYRQANVAITYWETFPAVTNTESTQVVLTGLLPNTQYTYQIWVNGVRATDGDASFYTFPVVGSSFNHKLTFVSCTNEEVATPQNIWARIKETDPRLLLHLGDSNYENSYPLVNANWRGATMAIRREQKECLRTVPQVGVWDDHDYGGNPVSGPYAGQPHIDNMFALWKEFWPCASYGGGQSEPGGTNPGGIFFKISYGDVEIYMLDTRFARDYYLDPDVPGRKMIGDAQFAWLQAQLAASTAKFKILCSGSSWKRSSADGWDQYTEERNRVMGLTKLYPGMVFIGGDIHVSLVDRYLDNINSRYGYPIYDALASGTWTTPVSGQDWRWFLNLDIDTTIPDPTITYTIKRYDATGVTETPLTPAIVDSTTDYFTTYNQTVTVALSELQPPTPGVPYVMECEGVSPNADGATWSDTTILNNLSALTTNATWLMWYVPRELSVAARALWYRSSGTVPWQIHQTIGNEIVFYPNSTSFSRTTSGINLVLNTPILIGVTYDGSQGTANNRIQFYANGQPITKTGASSVPTALNVDATKTLRVGGSCSAQFGSFGIFNTTKSAADMLRLYNDWISGASRNWSLESGLVFHARFQGDYVDGVSGIAGARSNLPLFKQRVLP